jgi:hypothetical protein
MANNDDQFEFAGKTLLAAGTSWSPKLTTHQVIGQPVRGDQAAAARAMQGAAASANASASGTHRPVGQPTRTS